MYFFSSPTVSPQKEGTNATGYPAGLKTQVNAMSPGILAPSLQTLGHSKEALSTVHAQ